MIKNISYINLRGQSREHDLGKVNIITGRNGAGKTSLIDAVSIAAQGFIPHDHVGKKSNEVFNVYCGEENSRMSATVTSDAAKVVREYTKKDGRVSCDVWLNDRKVSSIGDLSDKLKIKEFDLTALATASPKDRAKTLLGFVGVSEAVMADFEKRLKVLESKKKKAEAERKDKDSASRELRAQFDDAKGLDVGSDFSKWNEQLKELRERKSAIDKEIIDVRSETASFKRVSQDVEDLTKELFELQTNAPDEPEGMRTYDVEDLRDDVAAMDAKAEEYVSLKAKLKSRKEDLDAMRNKPPAPPASSQRDYEDLIEQAKALKASAGGATPEDEAIYKFFNNMWKTDLKAAIEEHCPDAKDELLKAMRKHITPIKERVQAVAKTADVSELERAAYQVKVNIDRYQRDVATYDAEQERKARVAEEVRATESKLEGFEYSEDEHHEARAKLASFDSRNKDVEQALALFENHQRSVESKMKALETKQDQLDSMTAPTRSTDVMEREQAELESSIEKLEGSLEEYHKAKFAREQVDKTEARINELKDELQKMKGDEFKIKQERRELVKQAFEDIKTKVDRVIHPATFECEIDDKRDGVFNMYHCSESGLRVRVESLCGAESVRFHIAMARALTGEQGVIRQEVDAVDAESLPSLIERCLQDESDTQYFLVGHNLGDIVEGDGVKVINLNEVSA